MRDNRRVLRRGVRGALKDGNDGAHLVAAVVLLARHENEVARRNGHATLRPDAGRQHLAVLRGGGIGDVVDRNQTGALEVDEEERHARENAVEDVFGLDALVARAALRVVTNPRSQVGELAGRRVDDVAVPGEDGEAARAAVEVALVGSCEVLGAHPRHAIGLARNLRNRHKACKASRGV